MKVDHNIESEIIEKITEKSDNTLEPATDTKQKTVEWENGFTGLDHTNPNHIVHDESDKAFCGKDSVDLCLGKLHEHTRESLLHPDTHMETPDRFCSECLEEFREMYDFALTKEEITCPVCNSQHKAYVNPKSGVYKCDCGWNVEE